MRGFDVFGNVRSAVARLAWMGALVVASTAWPIATSPNIATPASARIGTSMVWRKAGWR